MITAGSRASQPSPVNPSLELIAARLPFSEPLPVAEVPAQHDLDYRTHFERRMRTHGKPVFRAEFSK